MSYLDTLSQSMQGTYGGYSQVHRKPRYTMIGQTRMTEPTRLSLGGMYGQTPASYTTPLPTMGEPPTYTIPPGEETIDEITYGADYESYLETSPDWEKVWIGNEQKWMPTNPQEGQIYDDTIGNRYVFRNNQWIAATETYYGRHNIYQEWVDFSTRNPEWAQRYGYRGYLAKSLWSAWNQNNTEAAQAILDEMRLKGLSNADIVNEFEKQIDYARDKGYSDIADMMQTALDESGLSGAEYAITDDWVQGFEDIVTKMSSGDIVYLDENGLLDTTALREQGAMGSWLADMLEESYKTGQLGGDFYDEEGNIAPELQAMLDSFSTQDETTRQQFFKINRELAAHAIASGQTANSGYYADSLANIVADRAAKVTDQFANVMMNEMETQYNYMANSMGQMLKAMGIYTDEQTFADTMATEREKALEGYRQTMLSIAAEIGETEAGSQGNIITSAIVFVLNAIMLIL